MKVDITTMTEEQQKRLARNFRNAPCIICGREQVGFRKLMVRDQVAFLPLCEKCQHVDKETLYKAMEMADAVTDPNLVSTRRSS